MKILLLTNVGEHCLLMHTCSVTVSEEKGTHDSVLSVTKVDNIMHA